MKINFLSYGNYHLIDLDLIDLDLKENTLYHLIDFNLKENTSSSLEFHSCIYSISIFSIDIFD
jgi:hypothetical protein